MTHNPRPPADPARFKSLSNYGQQQALTGFTNYYNELAGQQSTGLSGASALAGVGQNYANAVGANNTNAANAVGNAALVNANTINSALGNIVSGYGYSQGLGSSYGSKVPAGQAAYGIAGSDGIY